MRTENSHFWSEISVGLVLIAIICLAVPRAPGENKKVWQPGTVMQVKAHQVTSGSNKVAKQYDVTVKVGKKIYSALYTLKEGEPDLDWGNYLGQERMVLIEGDTLTFNDLLGRPHSLKIVGRKDVPEVKAK
jgi:hypothetical protein